MSLSSGGGPPHLYMKVASCDANYSLDPGIDKILDDAFQREYDKR